MLIRGKCKFFFVIPAYETSCLIFGRQWYWITFLSWPLCCKQLKFPGNFNCLQRFERTDAQPISEREIQLSQFSGWGKGNLAQNKDNFTGGTEGKLLLHEARAVEVISFLRANRRMSTFRSTLKELGFVFLNTNGKAQNKYKQNPVIGKETQK